MTTERPAIDEILEAVGNLREAVQTMLKDFHDKGDHYIYTGSMNQVETVRDFAHAFSNIELTMIPDTYEDAP